MANVYDVGQYITELIPNVDKMKLYKLCYFAQGWNLAWTGRPLFREPLQAWAKGPVPVDLRNRSEPIADRWAITHIPGGDSNNLSAAELHTIKNVVAFYEDKDSIALSQISHGKAWTEARRGLSASELCQGTLSVTTMREEFTDMLHNTQDIPSPPAEVFDLEQPSIEAALAAATKIEKVWNDSLALLATR
ncbi:hypothetical protein VH13_09195 [Corynebacterium ulcerans]|uniref:Panacea domain-containing protein n=1 Tax=Corynebacterium ulcerans TaxID=65058 RepID=UPI0006285351|nr:Panacea domain-containing protein [Corynebacterium ulcerans]KKO84895.1 hypothetical protein VH13_09195 [Corynebacterium ulcerans]KKO86915.1 hypothetical protein VH15_07850 [Corynebacterium ulcerans]KPJ23761.1 hypothetical protein AOT31_09560 [Corynebacterium ulcerans]BDV26675.1 hypothetical protein CULTSU28_19230 [Corynebacterium ulcerans]